jgi:hypothetical protein
MLHCHKMKAVDRNANEFRARHATITHYLLVQRYDDVFSSPN